MDTSSFTNIETMVAAQVPNGRWWRILPPAIIAYMDRMNISFAMASGMRWTR
jgi:hypothetical protein